jgi:tripartite-type tricarboxylate transporter receptor subunit TctC
MLNRVNAPVRRGVAAMVLAPALVAGLLNAGVAAADDVAAFYSGKSIELIIGYPPAGSNDIYGRIVAQHLVKYIPGTPRIIVRNMPGAGSLVAANHIYNRAPRDGSILGVVSAGIPLQAKLGQPQARFEPGKFPWIGRIQSSSSVTMVWHTSKIKSLEDVKATEVVLGATGAGSTGSLYPNVMNEVLKTKFKLVQGYKGTHEAMLAMERGEVEGHSTTWEAVKSVNMRWVNEGQVRILVQHGLSRNPDMPNIPTSVELTTNPDDRSVMRAIMGAAEVGKAYFTAPETPADRVAALRRAFDAMMKDPKFIEDVEKVHGEIAPMTGEQMQELIGELDTFPQSVIDRVRVLHGEQ